ncbi:MAG: hypothetical protein PHC88_02075 [Terrimicrobiaceae bacterium]|nr:hypothetical protein [Terrimicrobiaceae bacterium]
MMKASIIIVALLAAAWTTFAATLPVRWFEGAKGYEKAMELQKETKLPILVWTTWNDCPYCGEVTAYLNKPKPRRALQEYIRVIIDEHGKPADAAFAKEHKFTGGNFFIVPASSPDAQAKVWAWEPGEGRIILPDLEGTLASKLAAAKQ